jgi:OOP family OmpA-OmpF porin
VVAEKPAPPPEPAPVAAPPAKSAAEIAKEQIEAQRITFAIDSAEIDGAGHGVVQRVSKLLAANPGARVVVQGHSDDTGPADYNQQLSERRANSVESALLAAGIPKDRLETRGFGPSQPLENSEAPEARAKNRRVDFQVILK